jgi:hypothetical protein
LISDPDPGSDWIEIQMGQQFWIRIGNPETVLGMPKLSSRKGKKIINFMYEGFSVGLETSTEN